MSELCRLRRSEGYEARDDDKQDKRVASYAAHFCPQCGQFTKGESGVTKTEEIKN